MTHRYCNQPDRDVSQLECGYPLPCPHHTYIIDATELPTVTVPSNAPRIARQKVGEIARTLKRQK